MSPLLFPIEIISHLARVMSLTIRLYANMLASDLVTLVFFSLVPIAIPSIFLGLHFAVSVIQAYRFHAADHDLSFLADGARALISIRACLSRRREKDSAGERFRFGTTEGCKREGASTVSLNHPLAANSKGSWRNMRKLQYVFMALAALCFAIPAFADGGSAVINLVPIGAGIGMGLAAGLCGLGQGKAVGSAVEALARNPGARAGIFTFSGSRPGPHRVTHPLHPGDRLRQGQVGNCRIQVRPCTSQWCRAVLAFEYVRDSIGWPCGIVPESARII